MLAYIARARAVPARDDVPDPRRLQPAGRPRRVPGGRRDPAPHAPARSSATWLARTEVLLVQQGRCEVDVYSDDRRLVATRELQAGDILIAVGGGHGFRVLEDTGAARDQTGAVSRRRREGAVLIPVNEPLLTEADYASVMDALRSGWISGAGPHVEAFEARWAAYCGRKHGIALANGSVALQVAVALLDLQPGDEVIMPTFTIISCAWPVVLAGAMPVLVDSDPRTWTMDVDQVEARITRAHARADAGAHLRPPGRHGPAARPRRALRPGRSSRMPPRPTAPNIAAAAPAASARRAASASTPTSWSPPAKAACCWSTTMRLAERARRLRNLGFQPGRRFLHAELGFNFRLDQPAGGAGRDPGRAHRRASWPASAAWARRIPSDCPKCPASSCRSSNRGPAACTGCTAWSCARTPGWTPPSSARRLAGRGVETRPFFLGMHEQPVLRERGLFAGESYPVAERIARQGLYLPSGLGLEEAQIERVCQAVARGARVTPARCSAATTPPPTTICTTTRTTPPSAT